MSETVTSWIQLDPSKLNTRREEMIRGAQKAVFVSPDDIPIALRVVRNTTNKTIRIEFKYIGEEPQEVLHFRGGLRIMAGRNSRRIFGLEILIDDLSTQDIKGRLLDTLDEAFVNTRNHPGYYNHILAHDIIQEDKVDLISNINQVAA